MGINSICMFFYLFTHMLFINGTLIFPSLNVISKCFQGAEESMNCNSSYFFWVLSMTFIDLHRHDSSMQVWERLRVGLDDNGQRNTSCPTGIHPRGMCSCGSFLTEESSTRASISRIVMLAEALFEVIFSVLVFFPCHDYVFSYCPKITWVLSYTNSNSFKIHEFHVMIFLSCMCFCFQS